MVNNVPEADEYVTVRLSVWPVWPVWPVNPNKVFLVKLQANKARRGVASPNSSCGLVCLELHEGHFARNAWPYRLMLLLLDWFLSWTVPISSFLKCETAPHLNKWALAHQYWSLTTCCGANLWWTGIIQRKHTVGILLQPSKLQMFVSFSSPPFPMLLTHSCKSCVILFRAKQHWLETQGWELESVLSIFRQGCNCFYYRNRNSCNCWCW